MVDPASAISYKIVQSYVTAILMNVFNRALNASKTHRSRLERLLRLFYTFLNVAECLETLFKREKLRLATLIGLLY